MVWRCGLTAAQHSSQVLIFQGKSCSHFRSFTSSSANSSSSDPWRRPVHAEHYPLPQYALLGAVGRRPAARGHRVSQGRRRADAAPPTRKEESLKRRGGRQEAGGKGCPPLPLPSPLERRPR